MQTGGAEVIGLDERIEEIRAEVERSGQIAGNLAKIRKAEKSLVQVTEQATYQTGQPAAVLRQRPDQALVEHGYRRLMP